MISNIVNVTQIRDNLAEILGRVKFGEEIVMVEKKGKPYAVIMSPEEYRRYKDIAKKAFQTTVAKIQAKNANTDEEEIRKDVNKAVEAVRLTRYGRGK
jgi:prevent-host-death family protein